MTTIDDMEKIKMNSKCEYEKKCGPRLLDIGLLLAALSFVQSCAEGASGSGAQAGGGVVSERSDLDGQNTGSIPENPGLSSRGGDSAPPLLTEEAQFSGVDMDNIESTGFDSRRHESRGMDENNEVDGPGQPSDSTATGERVPAETHGDEESESEVTPDFDDSVSSDSEHGGGYGFIQDGLFYNVWGPHLKYCLEPGSARHTSRVALLQDAINSTWGGISGAHYSFNSNCDSIPWLERKRHARVTLDLQCKRKESMACVRRGSGTWSRGVQNGVRLPIKVRDSTVDHNPMTWISAVVHEFGHLHGFAHEHNRPDFPMIPGCERQGRNGDVLFGLPGEPSIMLYRGCGDRRFLPSATDGRMARDLFGAQAAKFVDVFKFHKPLVGFDEIGPRSGYLVTTKAGQMAGIYDGEIYVYSAKSENEGVRRRLSYRKIRAQKDTFYLVAGPSSDEFYRVDNNGDIFRWQGRVGNWDGWTQLSFGTLNKNTQYVVSNAGTIYRHQYGNTIQRLDTATNTWQVVGITPKPTFGLEDQTIYPGDGDSVFYRFRNYTQGLHQIGQYVHDDRIWLPALASGSSIIQNTGVDQLGNLYWTEQDPKNAGDQLMYRYGNSLENTGRNKLLIVGRDFKARDFLPGYDTIYTSNEYDFLPSDPDRGDWGYLYEWVSVAYKQHPVEASPTVGPPSDKRSYNKWVPYIHLAPWVYGEHLQHMRGPDEFKHYAVFVDTNKGFWTVGENTNMISF